MYLVRSPKYVRHNNADYCYRKEKTEAHSGDRLTLDASPVLPRNDPRRRAMAVLADRQNKTDKTVNPLARARYN